MVVLTLYRLAWALALPLVIAMSALEHLVRALTSKPLWPVHWRLVERLTTTLSEDDDAPGDRETIWLHAASLGESKGLWAFAKILSDHLEASGRGTRMLLTTNTVTGLAFLKREVEARARVSPTNRWSTRLAPLDHPRLVRRFLRAHTVRALVLFEVELWPHWIAAARRAGVPTLWISARLTARARRRYAGHQMLAGALARVLREITFIQTQTEGEEHALRRLGAARVETGGDLRGLYSLRSYHVFEPMEAATIHHTAHRHGIAFVSIHANELTTLLPLVTKASTTTPLYIFPRQMHEVPAFLATLEPHGFALHSVQPGAPRVIVDSFGLVGETLMRVQSAVIGGSFGSDDHIGGHNLWEPLLAGCRLAIGPHYHNQRALAERLQARGLLHIIVDTSNTTFDVEQNRSGDLTEPDFAMRHALIHEEHKRLNEAAARVIAVLNERDAAQDAHFS